VNTAVLFKTRGETKVKIDFTLDDIWDVFKSTKLKEYTKKQKIDKQLFAKIAKETNQEIINLIIEKNFEYLMPCNLGILSIKKALAVPRLRKDGKLASNLTMDYKATRELWLTNPEARALKKKVFNLNEHSNGFRYSFYWSKKESTAMGKSVYMFKTVRANSRLITQKTKENPHLDYYVRFDKPLN
jgi:hypothetical protein